MESSSININLDNDDLLNLYYILDNLTVNNIPLYQMANNIMPDYNNISIESKKKYLNYIDQQSEQVLIHLKQKISDMYVCNLINKNNVNIINDEKIFNKIKNCIKKKTKILTSEIINYLNGYIIKNCLSNEYIIYINQDDNKNFIYVKYTVDKINKLFLKNKTKIIKKIQ